MLLEAALVGFVLLTTVLIALLEDILASVATFAAFSLGLGLIWVLLAAPDVALAEAAVGAGVLTILFVIAIVVTAQALPQEQRDDENDRRKETRAEDDPTELSSIAGRLADGRLRSIHWRTLLVIAALAVPMGFSLAWLPAVGDPSAPAVSLTYPDGSLTPYGYYVEQTYEETGLSNAVAAVLIVYRGLDTFGELVVIYTAAVGVLVVLDREVLTS